MNGLTIEGAGEDVGSCLVCLVAIAVTFSLVFTFGLITDSRRMVRLSANVSAFGCVLTFIGIIVVFIVYFLVGCAAGFVFRGQDGRLKACVLLKVEGGRVTQLLMVRGILLTVYTLILTVPLKFVFDRFMSLMVMGLLNVPRMVFVSVGFISVKLLTVCFLTVCMLILLGLLQEVEGVAMRSFLCFSGRGRGGVFHDGGGEGVVFVIDIVLKVATVLL